MKTFLIGTLDDYTSNQIYLLDSEYPYISCFLYALIQANVSLDTLTKIKNMITNRLIITKKKKENNDTTGKYVI